MFQRFTVSHVFPRHTSRQLFFSNHKRKNIVVFFFPGTLYPDRFVLTYFPVLHVYHRHMFSPLAYVFPRLMFSRGTCVPTVSRGTCIPPAHVSLWHIFSHGTSSPVTLVSHEINTNRTFISQYRSWHIYLHGICSSHGTCFPEAHVFPRFTVAHVFPRHTLHRDIFSRVTCFPPAHVFPWHMFSHGTCFPEAHVFPRIPVVHVFPRHTFNHGTYFPTAHVFPLHLLVMR